MRRAASQAPGGRSSGWRRSAVVRRPWTFPARPRAAARVSSTTQPPAAVGHGHQRAGRRLVVGEPALAQRHIGRHPLRRSALDGRPRGAASRSRPAGAAAAAGPQAEATACRSQASRMVRQPVQRQRWASSACSTAAVSSAPAPLAASADSRTTMPGVQNPHWLAPVAQNASPHAVALGRVEALEGGDRPSPDPPGRGHARHPGAGRRPAPCSSRTGPGGCTRPWPSAAPVARATRSARDSMQPPISTVHSSGGCTVVSVTS